MEVLRHWPRSMEWVIRKLKGLSPVQYRIQSSKVA